MTDRTYRLLIGALLLTFLYLDLPQGIAGMIAVALLEGITNLRIPKIIRLVLPANTHSAEHTEPTHCTSITGAHIQFEAERAWRLGFAILLLATYFGLQESLWFIPWFLGFAIMGAGVSGVCPMLLIIKWIGFVDKVKKSRNVESQSH